MADRSFDNLPKTNADTTKQRQVAVEGQLTDSGVDDQSSLNATSSKVNRIDGTNDDSTQSTIDENDVKRLNTTTPDYDLAKRLGMTIDDNLSRWDASALFLRRVPIAYARQHQVLGLASNNGRMPVAMADVSGLSTVEVLGRYLGCDIEPILAPVSQIHTAINTAYQKQSGQAQAFIEHLDRRDVLAEVQQLGEREDLLDVATRAPVIKLVNLLLFEAVKLEASDVHVQPYEERLVVRMRIDGVLYDAFELPKALQEEVVSRIKVMGRMNIAEKRLPQDGRTTAQVGDRLIDLRISSVPTSSGERVVIRLLDKSLRLYTLGELGMHEGNLKSFRSLIRMEHGLLLVTGPTGSGKSTTLYAALRELNATETNILTLEDPIEYQLSGVSQIQVSERKGMTFASGLRSVLRQDPDVIMVGEIRDHDTSVMAIQSALTGHLVFSTLHTNDASSAVTRLLDLGVEPYLVASSLVGVLAQRLVRYVCRACGQPHELTNEEIDSLELDRAGLINISPRKGSGCEICRNTGYRGRLGIFELMTINDAIREQINHRAPAATIKQEAIKNGMRTLREDGVEKVRNGTTTVDEVLRVTMRRTY